MRPGAVDATGSELGSGRYRVGPELARGGMGIVHGGHDAALSRDVALKLLRPELVTQQEMRRRFVREARIHARLQHPGVVPVYRVGQDAARRPWIAMQWIRGRTLAEVLEARAGAPTSESDTTQLFAIVEQIARTLAWAHRRGIVHRDLKPENIMVGAFGEVQVMDWGLAKGVGEAPDEDEGQGQDPLDTSSRISIVGAVLGTPAYMSPEQARGDPDAIDVRADVFSLGALLCEVLTGEPPYRGRGAPVVLQAYRGDLDGAHERLDACRADEELIALTRACLEREREARPADAGAVASSLAELRATTTRRARAAAVAAAEERAKAREAGRARRLTLAILGAVALFLALAVGGTQLVRQRRAARAGAALGQVRAALNEAAAAEGSEGWSAAEHALLRARSIAAAASLAPNVTGTIDKRLVRVSLRREADARAAREALRAEALARDVAPLELRALLGEDVARDFAAAFERSGLDPSSATGASLADLRRAADVGGVVRALDAWLRLVARDGTSSPLARDLAELASSIDPEPMRVRLRTIVLEQDEKELARLAVAARAASLEPATVLALTGALVSGAYELHRPSTARTDAAHAAALEAALELARQATRTHPSDLAAWLARLRALDGLPGRSPAQTRELALACATLRALAPPSEILTRRLIEALVELGELREAALLETSLAGD